MGGRDTDCGKTQGSDREVIVSPLVHASYTERGTPIRIGFYDDRIQVDSPGLLLPGMTIDTMRRVSRLRNPALARVFREAGIMEQWGTGVQRVFEQVAEAGLPEPVIEEIQDRVRVTIYVPSHDPSATGEQRSESDEHDSDPSEQVGAPSRGTKSLSQVTKSEHQVTKERGRRTIGSRSSPCSAPQTGLARRCCPR